MSSDAAAPIRFTDGDAYERFMGPWSRSVGTRFLDWVAPPGGLVWADIGCGNGAFTELILARAAPASILAIDPSEGQIAAARRRVSDPRAEFRIGDAMALPYPDGSADIGAMALVLFFLPDPAKGARELARVTRSGGIVASYTWDVMRGGTPPELLWQELARLGRNPVLPPSAEISRFENLTALWREIGLVDIETCEIVVARTYADFEDYWSAMVLNSPSGIVGKLSEEETATLRRRLEMRLPRARTGEITVHSIATAIKGRKP